MYSPRVMVRFSSVNIGLSVVVGFIFIPFFKRTHGFLNIILLLLFLPSKNTKIVSNIFIISHFSLIKIFLEVKENHLKELFSPSIIK